MEIFTCPDKCCNLKIKKYIESDIPLKHPLLNRNKAGIFFYDPSTDKVLLVQSRGNMWGPPKGTIEEESEIECAIREVKEETGLLIDKEAFNKKFVVCNQATYFYIEMNECDVNVQKENDANGIGWIKTKCLEKCIQLGNIELTHHTRLLFKKIKGKTFIRPNFKDNQF
jgi:8-oxo-dGTP pyrophosphatase MutT (NUDIX family)